MRALAKHGSLKEAQRSGLRRLARQDSPALKQSILRADAPPPGRPGASLATLTGLAAYLSRGGGIAAELRKKKGRHVLHSDLGLQKYRDERRRVKPRPRRVRQRRAEAQRRRRPPRRRRSCLRSRKKARATRQLLKWYEERRKVGIEAPSRGVGGGARWGADGKSEMFRFWVNSSRKSPCYEASPRSSARAARARSYARCESRRLSRSPLTRHAR